MKKKSVLIVDDESYIREFLAQILSEYFRVTFAQSGAVALEIAESLQPSIILLDVMMPGLNGIEICGLLRQKPRTKDIPIIMLTAVNEPEQRIQAFNAGADDYLAKPFLPDELVARINRKLERSSSDRSVEDEVIPRLGNLELHFHDFRLEVNGSNYDLGQVECKILNTLLKNKGQLVSRQELNDSVWGDELPSDRALDPHITSLRKKLHNSQGELKTVYGKGYAIILKKSEY